MVSVASSSATMDLTAVLPALMEGIAQEVGVDINASRRGRDPA